MITVKPISVLVAEDHSVVREGLCSLLKADVRFTVAGEAKNGREAVRMALATQPDVILLDISMPLLNGFEAARQILGTKADARILILSAHTDDEYVDTMIKIGVLGYLEKHSSVEILIRALIQVANGLPFLTLSTGKRLLHQQSRPKNRDGLVSPERLHLTAREREVLQLVAESMANKQIASELIISTKTVEKHRQSVMDKLNIHDTAGLTRYAMAAGMIEVGAKLTVI